MTLVSFRPLFGVQEKLEMISVLSYLVADLQQSTRRPTTVDNTVAFIQPLLSLPVSSSQ